MRHDQLALVAHDRHAAATEDPIVHVGPDRRAAEHRARARRATEHREQGHPALERPALVMRVLVPTAGVPIRDRAAIHEPIQASSVRGRPRGRWAIAHVRRRDPMAIVHGPPVVRVMIVGRAAQSEIDRVLLVVLVMIVGRVAVVGIRGRAVMGVGVQPDQANEQVVTRALPRVVSRSR